MAAKRKNPLPPRWDIEALQDGTWHAVGSVRATFSKAAVPLYRREHPEWSRGKKLRVSKRQNPAAESIKAYKDFHGREPDEMVKVVKEIHYHRNLAGAGKLEKIVVQPRTGGTVSLSAFKGAILAYNEKKTQLFVEGGDQRVDLKAFGVKTPHEQEVLGEVVRVDYFTRKDHLRPEDGGTAIFQHKFKKPRPTLVYDVPNEQLIFAGGGYTIPDEGIDR